MLGYKLDWSDVPLGRVLNKHIAPSPAEERAFAQWLCPTVAAPHWKRWSFWDIATEDDGRKVLEHWDKSDGVLVTGEADWGDVAIEALVCPLVATSQPHPDDEHCIVGRSGVIARMETVRRYYYFCIEGHSRLVLYCRTNNEYRQLSAREVQIDPSKYYRLRLEVSSNRLRGFCNGEEVADVFDATIHQGRVGIRTNTLSRFENIEALISPHSLARLEQTRAAQKEALEELRSRYPKPVLACEIDLTPHGGGRLLGFGRFGSGQANDLLVQTERDGKGELVALTFGGELIWRQPASGKLWPMKFRSSRTANSELVVGIAGKELLVINNADGTVRARRPLPPIDVFPGFDVFTPYIGHLRKGGPGEIVLVQEGWEGGEKLWCYDADLNPLWEINTGQPRHGHNITFYDFDGDGREEICAGFHLLSPDGKIIWRIEGGRSMDVIQFGRHADAAVGADFDGDGRGEIAIAAGGEGFLLCDATTGKIIAKHDIGHAQGLVVGNFRPDLAGLEIHVGTRWGNYGIRAVYGARGEHLHTFQPDFIGQQGIPVNWSGDGEELIFLESSPAVFGFWNAFGQKVVPLDDLPVSLKEHMYRGSHPPIIQSVLG